MTDPNKIQNQPAPEAQDKTRARTAKLMHDVSTPLLTIRALAETLVGDDPGRQALKAGIDRQLDRVQRLLDSYWQNLDALGTPAGPGLGVADEGPQPLRALSILVVDDDEIHREISDRLLSRLGHRVQTCADGQAARAFEADKWFDLLLLDQHTPHESGTDYVRTHRPAGAKVPYFVGMSSDPRNVEIERLCREAGMQDYVEKPLTEAKLRAMLARFIKQRGF